MDLFSAEALSALLTIILIDLVLAGDNALVIGLVARQLPKEKQWSVILWGTAGAIIARVLMAILVVYILQIPGFLLVGGLALIWIARKLVMPQEGHGEHGHAHGHGAAPAQTMSAAIRTIVIADAVMGVDNVLAIGGVARDSIVLLIIGLAISIPIVVGGSRLVIRLVDRFPAIILIGGGVLAWTAAKMIMDEPLLKEHGIDGDVLKALIIFVVFAISLEPWISGKLPPAVRPIAIVVPGAVAWFAGVEIATILVGVEGGALDAQGMGAVALIAVQWLGWLPFALVYLFIRRRLDRRAQKPEMAGHSAH